MARAHTFDNFPNVSTYADRKGDTRYRFRCKGVNTTMRGDFDSMEFRAHYDELVTLAAAGGVTTATPERLKQTAKLPEDCFRNCWAEFKESRDFTEMLSDYSIGKMLPPLERFLMSPIRLDIPQVTFDMVPVGDITFDEIEDYLWRVAKNKTKERGITVVGGPSAANFALRQLKKLFKYAVKRKRWIKPEQNPIPYVDKIKIGKSNANRCWTVQERKTFEAYFPLGTPQRTMYALALYMGNRRSDITKITWDDVRQVPVRNADGSVRYEDAFIFRQTKNSQKKGGEGGKEVTLVVVPQLAEALAHIERVPGRPVLLVERTKKGYQTNSLTSCMWRWKKEAGLPMDCTLHGLRSTYATILEEAGVSDKGQQSVMGHSNLATTEHYRRSAKNRLASIEAAEKLAHYNPDDYAILPAAHLRVMDGGKR